MCIINFIMKSISILGCGWLGKALAVALLNKGYLVKGSTTTMAKIEVLRKLGIQPFLIDLAMAKNIDDFLNTDVLIVAITYKELNDFKGLIERIEKSSVNRIIYSSTTSVYPSLNKVTTEEDETLETIHFKIEELFRNSINFKTTVVRFAGLFGGERHPANWFTNGRKIPQPNGFVNMIHLDDCIGILMRIIEKDCFGALFNACADHHPTRKEFYTYVKESNNLPTPEFEKNEVLAWKIVSSKKVQKALNYTFKHNNLLAI